MTKNDLFLNSGLPQMTNKNDFTKNDIKVIAEQIKSFDSYYGESYKKSETRKKLVNYINNYCVTCRWYSLIIK